MEKLVRHRLRGTEGEFRVARPEEMLGLLRAKLLEETAELVEAIDAIADEQILAAPLRMARVWSLPNARASARTALHQALGARASPAADVAACTSA